MNKLERILKKMETLASQAEELIDKPLLDESTLQRITFPIIRDWLGKNDEAHRHQIVAHLAKSWGVPVEITGDKVTKIFIEY